MKRYKCKNCMEKIELVEIQHPKTGETDEKVLWMMCECKGYRLGKPDELNYPQTWVAINQH